MINTEQKEKWENKIKETDDYFCYPCFKKIGKFIKMKEANLLNVGMVATCPNCGNIKEL